MKFTLVALLFAVSAFAQSPSARVASPCGAKDVVLNVKLDKAQHTLPQPESAKARVYFIQDDGPMGDHQHFAVRIGLDGEWVGAYKQNSYFTVSIEPGEHHVCANVQSDFSAGQLVELAHLTAEAGKVYYFRTRFIAGMTSLYPTPPYLELDPVDSDQAKYLITSYPLSISHPSK
jgi:hypothetical protein